MKRHRLFSCLCLIAKCKRFTSGLRRVVGAAKSATPPVSCFRAGNSRFPANLFRSGKQVFEMRPYSYWGAVARESNL